MKHIIIAALLLVSRLSLADDIRLGEPAYGGNGCPAGSASLTLSPDAKTLSILFDQFIVEAGSAVGKAVDRKSCNLAVPVHVPQGWSLAIFQVDYRGFNSLPAGGRSTLTSNYFFAGSGGSVNGARTSQSFLGPLAADYVKQDTVLADALVWSPCGADANLRINTSMTTFSNRRGEQAMSTVDSADLNVGMLYHFQWRRCR